jgi:hypothetical protein
MTIRVLGLLMALGAAGAALVAEARNVLAMSELPAPAESQAGKPQVQWVFSEASLLRCRTPGQVLRGIHAEFGSAVSLVGAAPGADREYVASFMRRERLAEVISVRTERGRRNAPALGPGLYLLVGDSVVVRVPAGARGEYPGSDRLFTELARLVPADVARTSASSTPVPLRRR